MLKDEKGPGGSSELRQRIFELEELSGRIQLGGPLVKSEGFSFAALAMLPVTLCLQASDYTIRFANRLFKEQFGDPQGRFCYEILHGRAGPCEECPPFEVLRSGGLKTGEWDRPDGRHFLVHYYPFVGVNDELLVLEIGLDTSEQRRAGEALRTSERKYRATFEATGTAMFLVDRDALISDTNREMEAVFGYSRGEVVRKMRYMELLMPQDVEKVKGRSLELLRGESRGPIRYEVKARHKSGRAIDASISINMMPDIEKSVISMIDVTERKQAEEALLATLVELERANRELEGFARTVSHDLKGPLAGVVSGGELMRVLLAHPWSEGTAQQVLEVAGVMQAGGENAIELIDNMLDLAQAGHDPRDAREVAVSGVLERILEERKDLIEKKGVKVEAAGELGRVHASPTHVYQLFANLVGNAIRYNDNPAPRVEVRYLGKGAGGAHRYLVRDNGPGIPEGDLERVFDPFFKGGGGGTGIGLAIVEKIVKTYNGEIRARNDNGACFEFSLQDYVSEGGGHG